MEKGIKEISSIAALTYILKALLLLGLIFLFAKEFAAHHLWVVVLSVFLTSIPIALGGIYCSSVNKVRKLHIFGTHGLLYRLISRRVFITIFWCCWSLVSAFFMLIQFYSYTKPEWLVFLLVMPAFWFSFRIAHRFLSSELKPYIVTSMALTWSKWLCSLIMLALYLLFFLFLGPPATYPSLEAAIDAQKQTVSALTDIAIVWESAQSLAFYQGAKLYAFGRLGAQDSWFPLLVVAGGSFVIFFNACIMLSCLLIPRTEYRRVFGPLTDANVPSPISASRVALISATVTFSMFIYVPMFAYLEERVQKNTRFAEARHNVEALVIAKLEEIEGELYREGTIAEIQAARLEAMGQIEMSFAHLENAIDNTFDQVETNVDGFLDWYYSLPGEYTRIGNLMIGDLENYMIKKLTESLEQGDAFKEVEATINQLVFEYAEFQHAYQKAAQEILQRNRLASVPDQFEIVYRFSLQEILHAPVHRDVIGLESRLIASGGGGAMAGVMTAVVARQVVVKVVGKSTLKLAAQAMGKIVVSKVGGAVSGAGIGALAGSAVLPGVGTVVGGALGLVGGLVLGVTVDGAFLLLEEHINRDKFREEIIAAIRNTQQEFKAKLRVSDPFLEVDSVKHSPFP